MLGNFLTDAQGNTLYMLAADNGTRGTVEGHDLSSYGDLWFVAAP